MKIIDAWTHITPPGYFDRISQLKVPRVQTEVSRMRPIQESKPHFTNKHKRIEDLDRYSFAMQVTMIQPNLDPTSLDLTNEQELELAKLANDELAQIMDSSNGRIFALGVVPLNATDDRYVEEMRRAIRDLGLKGFMVMTNLKGTPVDQFEPLWAEAERLGAVVYLHPVDPVNFVGRPYEDQYDLAHVFGWPFETSLVLPRLIFSGIMEKYPTLKIVAHHLGGMIPFFSGRIRESYSERASSSRMAEEKAGLRKRLSKPVWEYFKQFYYDTAVASASAIKCGFENFSSKNLVFSTDYPWGEDGGRARLASYPKLIQDLNLPPQEQSEIFEENIRRLIKI
ncbi:MAG: amidohydrolase [Thaumarchaeota archaeon]|nr:amidohydrolase [Nitrososphaerota archaeon]